MTASAVAYLLPRRWCFGYSWTGGPPWDCSDFPLWGGILVVGVGLVVGLMLASFAREKSDGGHRADGFTEGPESARDRFPSGKSGA
jgi:hypothetical protein